MGLFQKLDVSAARVNAMTAELGVDLLPGMETDPELAAQRYRGRILRCATCGMFVAAVAEVDGPRAVLNASIFRALLDRPYRDAHFEDEDEAARFARRARTWTPIDPASTLPQGE